MGLAVRLERKARPAHEPGSWTLVEGLVGHLVMHENRPDPAGGIQLRRIVTQQFRKRPVVINGSAGFIENGKWHRKRTPPPF